MRNEREENSVNEVCKALNNLGFTTKKTDAQFENYDINLTGKTTGVIEVKNRDLDKETFIKYWTKEGFLLEDKKYERLTEKNAMYINIFNVNNLQIIIGWNLSGEKNCTKNRTSKLTTIKCPDTSEFNNSKTYVDKLCWLIKRRTSTLRMIKIDGEWIKMSMNEFNKYLGL